VAERGTAPPAASAKESAPLSGLSIVT